MTIRTMFVKTLKLLGFRNYLNADIEFLAPKTIIIGKNAQGKSNLLEVIQILSHIKSRRATKDAELVNFELDQAIIHAQASQDQSEENIEIALLIRKSGRRTLKINDVSKKPKDLLHHIYSVSFMVDDLEIINGSPSIRRDWMNSVIAQLNFDYNTRFDKFETILSQRNSFFKDLAERNIYRYHELNPSQQEQLAIWDQMFIDAANTITSARQDFIRELSPIAAQYYREISGTEIELELKYPGKILNQEDLINSRDRDFGRSYTNLGPHRDDIEFNLESNLAGSFASQGERRTITLALKLAELELLKSKHNESPILLLDDVLAELDEDRQDYLLNCISPSTQVIITTTHLGKHIAKWTNSAQILEIKSGSIVEGAVNAF